MKVVKITIISSEGNGDLVIVTTDLPEPNYPFAGNLKMTFQTPPNVGEFYVKDKFGDVPVKIRRDSSVE